MPRQHGEQLAERPVELDPHLAHAHLAVANIRAMLDWDWEAAEAGFRQAIALNTSSDGGHRWYGLLLAGLGRSSEAVREAQRAHELDPLCLVTGTGHAWTHYMAGDYQAAIETCRLVMDMQRLFTPAWRVLGASLIQMGRIAEGVSELEAAAAIAPTDPVLLAWLAHAKATCGECSVARTIIAGLKAPEKTVLITYETSATEISAFCRFLRVSIVQLHGDISPEEVRELRRQRSELRMIKSLIVRPEFGKDAHLLMKTARQYEPWIDAFITDTFDPRTTACGATASMICASVMSPGSCAST